jgi:uncharacterized protein
LDLKLPVDILFSIFIVSVVQSIFGVGVLLFGTPILLLLGYNYSETLLILLPISITISILQIFKHHRYVDIKFYKNILFFSIPLVILFLIIGITASININFFVGSFLVFTALKYFLTSEAKIIKINNNREKISLILMGIIHGLTNLGGSLLTAIIFNKQYDKNKTRVTIASCYLTFAIFQILTLFFINGYSDFSYNNFIFILVGGLTFITIEKTIFFNINSKKYEKVFSTFLLISGLALIIG